MNSEDVFEIRNGLKVWVSGSVVIEGVRHLVRSGYIKCNPSLNHSAWNVTEENEKCSSCFPQPEIILPQNGQLKLF